MDDDAQHLDRTPGTPTLIAKQFSRKDVESGLRSSLGKLQKAIAHGVLLFPTGGGTVGGLIDNLLEIPAAFAEGEGPESRAWTLVHRAAGQAILELVAPVVEMHPEIQGDYGEELARLPDIDLDDAAFEITVDFFERPAALPMAEAIRRTFEAWLPKLGLAEAQARTVAGRFDSYWAAALHDEWRRHPDAYQLVLEALHSPFADAAQMERDWARYRRWLIEQVDQPVFAEPFSLRQIYVPLRAWYEEADAKNPKGIVRRYSDEDRAENRKIVVDLRERVHAWWTSAASQSDAILLVSGGPGSGKSSFARMFAAELSQDDPKARILFLPLQRMYLRERTLTDAMGDILTATDRSSWEHFRDNPVSAKDFPDTDRRTLLIFDGLDELTKPGDKADEQTRAFIDDLRHSLDRWNEGKIRVLALVTGRTPTIQAHADSLKVTLQHRLNVLRFHVTDEEQDSYFDPEKRLAQDQRQTWWKCYHRLTRGTDDGLPEALDQDKFQDLTAEPLLNYLVAASGFRGSESGNRNELYATLFEDVAQRRHAQETAERERAGDSTALAPYHEYKDDFDQIMEAFATAAWRGDGRTAHLKDVLDACSQTVKERLDEFLAVKGGHHRLIATFYMQMDRSGREDAFEFTHKSLSEYLTARRLVREIAAIHRRLQSNDDLDDRRLGLAKWFRLCARQPLSWEIVAFLRDEVRLLYAEQNGAAEIGAWQSTLEGLFNLNLTEGMPAVENAPSYRSAEARAVNAEEALLAAANACALATKTLWLPDWRGNLYGLACLLNRLRRSRYSSYRQVCYALLGRMDVERQCLARDDFYVADLACANLRGADLRSAIFVGASLQDGILESASMRNAFLIGATLANADLRRADLTDAHLKTAQLGKADLRGASLKDADLEDADLEDANLEDANLEGANLKGARLNGARLKGANLQGVKLTKKQRAEAIFD
ncbi:MAG: pentapeptide repeat-containing protein [Rhodospirillaceae bacterium]|nr:pentapeptide repeat-containing protein [Rhodospirillaceae bacterium]